MGLFDLFSSICMLTAFLNVALGLKDFISDGFQLQKKGSQAYLSLALTFLPPLVMVVFNPGLYLKALNYAGIFCVLLQLLIPILMRWQIKPSISLGLLTLGGSISIILPYLHL